MKMNTDVPILHLVCGKIASGKSTLSHRLAAGPRTVLIAEDEWLSRLYPGEITVLQDYIRRAGMLRDIMKGHVEQLLRAGNSVVLDFPANTPNTRLWMREIIRNTGVVHSLHYLNVCDAECKERLHQRNGDGSHQFTISDAEFDAITGYFVPPSPDEGFNVIEE